MQPKHSDPFLLILAGLIITVFAGWSGFAGLWTSVVDGARTLSWPSTEGSLTWGSRSTARIWWRPDLQLLQRSYIYEVDGKIYSCAQYDVHGGFIGTNTEVERFAITHSDPDVKVFYDPSKPSRAVLKRGISFDHMTTFYLIMVLAGAGLAFAGLPNAREIPIVAMLLRALRIEEKEVSNDSRHSS